MQDTSGSRSLRQRWERYQPTKTQTLWIAVVAVVVVLIIGFGPGGWVTAGTADEMVAEAARNARQELASAVCVEKFLRDANAAARLEKIKEAAWFERDDLVGKWATMPDEKEPSGIVANMCAAELAKLDAPKATPATLNEATAK
jgi:hypothetical protein